MNQFRLRGTWEEDPAPIPFPRHAPGRHAGQSAAAPASRAKAVPETRLSARTRELMETVDTQFERLQLNFDEFRHLFETQESSFDAGPSAA